MRGFLMRPVRHHSLVPAFLGIMASVALLAAWSFVRRTGGLSTPPAFMMLELVTVFVMGLGTLVVAGMIVGVLPVRRRSARDR